tara:strand:+ start:382 stop:768 length:387 start_codon:yes stop_codon:yes gene_type:complete
MCNVALFFIKKGINMKWYFGVFKKYAVFSGRARRKEYWMFTVVNLGVVFVLSALTPLLDFPVGTVYILAVFIPMLAVTVRRLHDTGRSAWWLLISLIPLIGYIVLLIFAVLNGKNEENDYGENPKHQS